MKNDNPIQRQMYVETIGSSMYLVARAAKPLNKVEKRFMQVRGFIPQDSTQRIHRCYVGKDRAELASLATTLQKFGYVITGPVPVVMVEYTPIGQRDKAMAVTAAKMTAAMNCNRDVVVSITCQLANEKVSQHLADEECARYTRLAGNWLAY